MPDELKSLIKAYGEIREGSDKKVAALVTSLIEFVKGAKESLDKRVDSALDNLTKRVEARLESIREPQDGYTPIKGKDYFDGRDGYTPKKGVDYFDGEPGKNADPVDVAAAVTSIEQRIPQLGESIVDAINLLPTDDPEDKIDAKHIKNLPEGKTIYQGGGATTIWGLSDVSIAGITSGQHLEWDGVKWVAVTPAGSGGTPVYGEVLHTQGAGTTFTLANTPVAGTVRLFRGGAYQAAGAGEDYTISSATITLSVALVDGEKLLADYSYS